jgi:hypothetical protein
MKKGLYFSFLLVCLLALGLIFISCDLDLGNIQKPDQEQNQVLQVKDKVDTKNLVITITQNKPEIRAVATGNYYMITLDNITVSWGTITVGSNGTISFKPDTSSPGGTQTFSGTLSSSNELNVPNIPTKDGSITGVKADSNGGKGQGQNNNDQGGNDQGGDKDDNKNVNLVGTRWVGIVEFVHEIGWGGAVDENGVGGGSGFIEYPVTATYTWNFVTSSIVTLAVNFVTEMPDHHYTDEVADCTYTVSGKKVTFTVYNEIDDRLSFTDSFVIQGNTFTYEVAFGKTTFTKQ